MAGVNGLLSVARLTRERDKIEARRKALAEEQKELGREMVTLGKRLVIVDNLIANEERRPASAKVKVSARSNGKRVSASVEVGEFPCDHCPRSFGTEGGMKHHVTSSHPEQRAPKPRRRTTTKRRRVAK